jgi:hypothetical protein
MAIHGQRYIDLLAAIGLMYGGISDREYQWIKEEIMLLPMLKG